MTPPTLSGPRVLYISGPFSHPDLVHGILKNILLASEAALAPSRDDGDVTPHLVICVHPDHLYLAVKGEVAAVRTGTLDICKVVSA